MLVTHQKKEGINIKIPKRTLTTFLPILSVLVILLSVYFLFFHFPQCNESIQNANITRMGKTYHCCEGQWQTSVCPIKTLNYYGYTIGFRADLREAKRVSVYPDEGTVYYEIVNPIVENITIAFKDAGEKENPYYIVEEFEIINKLTLLYTILKDQPSYVRPTFNAVSVDSYEILYGTFKNPIIALVHPIYSNETAIRMQGHAVLVKGKDYKDFDLAVAKLLMILLKIEV